MPEEHVDPVGSIAQLDTSSNPEAARAAARRKRALMWLASIGVGVAVLVGSLAFLQKQGLEPSAWLADVWVLIAAIPLPFLLVALLMKLTEVALNAFAWMISLRAAFPDQRITYRQMFGVVQGGIALTSLIPPKFGSVALLGLYKVAFPTLPITTVLAARIVQGTSSAIVGFVMLILFGIVVGSGSEDGFFDTALAFARVQPLLAALIVAGLVALIAFLVKRGRHWLRAFGHQISMGGAILRMPRRYALLVVIPTLSAYALRWAVTGTLMAAFGIPVNWETLLRVNVSHGLSRTVQVTPGGLGTMQAFDLVALQGFAPVDVIAAYSLTQSGVLLIFNVFCGVVALLWAFGLQGAASFLNRGRTGESPAPAPAATPSAS